MSTGKPDRGFTIVEVLMFLAVTGVLMMVAMLTIGGSRQKAEFSASVRDFNSAIQGIISEVRTGYFPNKTDQVKCRVNTSTFALEMTGLFATAEQGAHPECVFLGKVLYFDLAATSPRNSVSVITVAGKAFVGGEPPATYSASTPVPVAGTVAGTVYASIDLTETLNLTNGLLITKVISSAAPPAPSAFGIFNSSANTAGGSLSANVVTIPIIDATGTLDATLKNIKNISTSTPTKNPTIAICLQHGGTNGTRAVVIIGFKDRTAYSSLHIADYVNALSSAITGETCP